MLNRYSEIVILSRFVYSELNPRVRCAFGDVLVLIWQMTYDEFHYQFLRFLLTYKPVFLLRQITSLSHYSAVAFVAHQLVLRCVPSKWSWSLQWYGLHCSELVQSCDKFWSSISH